MEPKESVKMCFLEVLQKNSKSFFNKIVYSEWCWSESTKLNATFKRHLILSDPAAGRFLGRRSLLTFKNKNEKVWLIMNLNKVLKSQLLKNVLIHSFTIIKSWEWKEGILRIGLFQKKKCILHTNEVIACFSKAWNLIRAF